MLIAQITDCHVVEPGHTMADRIDPAPGLRRAVAMIGALDPLPAFVLATGDLVNDGRPEQYERLAELLAPLPMPVLPVPGNHDDRSTLRRLFPGLPAGGPEDRIDYVVDVDAIRLIGLDTTIPGHHGGRVTPDQMDWLDERLAEAADRPALVFQHHPPFPSGIPWMDRDAGFEGADLEAATLRRHRHVEAVVCGHLHRVIHQRFGGTLASCWPSTAVQLALGFGDLLPHYTDEPTGFALHRVTADGVQSHLVPSVPAERWIPGWATA